jgi:hypothetical protein
MRNIPVRSTYKNGKIVKKEHIKTVHLFNAKNVNQDNNHATHDSPQKNQKKDVVNKS